MLRIVIPNNCLSERQYVLHIVFSYLLNIDKYEISASSEMTSTEIHLPNNTVIKVEDHFFSKYKREYVTSKNIPESPIFIDTEYAAEKNLVVLWGNDVVTSSSSVILVSGDIFASAFYFLSRWEEFVCSDYDDYGRFPDNSSFLVRNNLNLRPLVNEYAVFLMNCINKLCPSLNLAMKSEYSIVPTHDIDKFLRLDTRKKVYKAILGDILKRKSFKLALRTYRTYKSIIAGRLKDPYDTFSLLVDLSEKYNLSAYFFFIPGVIGECDVFYNFDDKLLKKTILEIQKRNHIVGIHPSMKTFLNKKQLKLEIDRLKSIGVSPIDGRQHYLRYKNPETWRIWDELGLKNDFGMSYHENVGFRCGMANSFPAFDVIEKRQLNLLIHPTIMMDQALFKATSTVQEFSDTCCNLKSICKKYNGEFVFLWHPENINVPEWVNYTGVLKSLYE